MMPKPRRRNLQHNSAHEHRDKDITQKLPEAACLSLWASRFRNHNDDGQQLSAIDTSLSGIETACASSSMLLWTGVLRRQMQGYTVVGGTGTADTLCEIPRSGMQMPYSAQLRTRSPINKENTQCAVRIRHKPGAACASYHHAAKSNRLAWR